MSNFAELMKKASDPMVHYMESCLLTKFQLLHEVDKLLSDTENDFIIVADSAYRSLCNFEDELLDEIVDSIDVIRDRKSQSTHSSSM